jgi:hypothetical protein
VNPFFFEIVQGQSDRYSWQLVAYLGGERKVIARSSRDWGSARKARKAAKATKNAACSARVVSASPRPGDIRFYVLKDVLALDVTGSGDTRRNGRRSGAGAGARSASATAAAKPAAAPPADPSQPAGDAAVRVDAPAKAAKAAPASKTEGHRADGDVSGSPKAGQPGTPPRKTARKTAAAAKR